jgi:hypothetical protein
MMRDYQINGRVGHPTREKVWDQVGSLIWWKVRDQVWSQVRQQVFDQVFHYNDERSYGKYSD